MVVVLVIGMVAVLVVAIVVVLVVAIVVITVVLGVVGLGVVFLIGVVLPMCIEARLNFAHFISCVFGLVFSLPPCHCYFFFFYL